MVGLKVNRRAFIGKSMQAFGTAVVSTGVVTQLTACKGSVTGKFDYGVASGDPLATSVILWTRVTPEQLLTSKAKKNLEPAWVQWQVAKDKAFKHLVISDAAETDADKDFTIKVDVRGLEPDTRYFYRFRTVNNESPIGITKTLPQGAVAKVKFGVVSCANYPAGYFHVYRELAKQSDLDAVLHLGDYLYEYARGEYASETAAAMGREVNPSGELLTLSDYRTRYAQYRTDPDLQAAHAAHPFIAVWDDHEVANDAWREGAQNHDETEGDFVERMLAALQAYSEWMPIRPLVNEDIASLQRSFQFGDLVNLTMLDTRIVGRDQQLELTHFFDANGQFDAAAYAASIGDPSRTLLGSDQLYWLQSQFAVDATWHVLGQQVLMGVMELPAAIATQQLSIAEFGELAQIAQLAASDPSALTAEQWLKLQNQGYLLQLGSLPYNLDAWDGYPVERATVLATAQTYQRNLVVLAGDTHNAWANQLKFNGAPVGVELATSSVSSPGLEDYLGLVDENAVVQTEMGLTQIIEDLRYTNLSDRGYLLVTFTPAQAKAEWKYVNTIKNQDYHELEQRTKELVVPVNSFGFA